MHSYSQVEPSTMMKQTAISTLCQLLQLTSLEIICSSLCCFVFFFFQSNYQNCQSPKVPTNTAQPHCADLLGGAGMDVVLLPRALLCRCTLTSWDAFKNQAIKCPKTSTPCKGSVLLWLPKRQNLLQGKQGNVLSSKESSHWKKITSSKNENQRSTWGISKMQTVLGLSTINYKREVLWML